MAYGDPSYTFLQSGSTARSASTTANLFGGYGGLSVLNEDAAVHIQVRALTYEYSIGPTGQVSNNIGYIIYPSASWVDLPPMRAGEASALLFSNFSHTASNASANWVIWQRNP